MKKKLIVIAGLFVITFVSLTQGANVFIDDGAKHVINDGAYQSNNIFLDFNIANNPGTHCELNSGGKVGGLMAGNNSTIEVLDGEIGYNLQAHDNSNVVIRGGTVGSYTHALGNGVLRIYGGIFNGPVCSNDNGIVHVAGGTINDYLEAFDGTIYLYGSNFKVGDVNLKYGDNLRDYGTVGSNPYWFLGIITGTLQDNTPLNADFGIHTDTDGAIIIVPEPASIILLGLGALVLRKKHY